MKTASKLLSGVEIVKVYGDLHTDIAGIADDSRKVEKDFLFVAIPGLTVDGHDYIDKAIEKGTSVIVGEKRPKSDWLEKATYVQVKNSRKALSILASNWYDNPSKKLKMIGVTGTDGKTTTTNIIFDIFRKAKKEVALINTISAKIGEKEYETGFHVTNPEPLELFKFLKKIVDAGSEYCVLEVTSHGLHQERVAAIDFDAAVLTNITHEHLDYHKSFKEYRETKAKLFKKAKKLVVLNKDDNSFSHIKKKVDDGVEVISYSTKSKADVEGKIVSVGDRKTDFDITFKDGVFKGRTNLVGEYNLQNILATVAVADYYKISNQDIINALEDINGLRGRMEEIENDIGLRIIVDFAHTPNSLEKVLTELKKTTKGKLIAVFGCAGERDIEKRELMPKISVGIADLSIFTAEDPRSEDVNNILSVMEKSATRSGGKKLTTNELIHWYKKNDKGRYLLATERGEAIYQAITKVAKRGDTVAILGKGHEKSMAYDGVEYPWSDQEAAREALKGKVKKITRK